MRATEIYDGFKFPKVFILYLSGAYTCIYLILCLNTYKNLYLFKVVSIILINHFVLKVPDSLSMLCLIILNLSKSKDSFYDFYNNKDRYTEHIYFVWQQFNSNLEIKCICSERNNSQNQPDKNCHYYNYTLGLPYRLFLKFKILDNQVLKGKLWKKLSFNVSRE